MQQKQTGKVFRIIVFILTAFMIGFVFFRSSMSAEASTVESESTLDFLINFFKSFGISVEMSENIVRKLAHFAEFFVIGGLLMSCAYGFDSLRPQRFGVRVLFAGMLTALIDETIQLFSEGRAGMIADVWIDMGGVVCGAALMLGFYTLLRRRRAKKKRKTDFEG